MPGRILHVAVGAIVRDQSVLISRRASGLHQGDKWEFPGGKLEPGESVCEALARELHEELGITPLASRPLIQIRHDYSDRSVLLDVWKISVFTGEPHHREGQPLRWVEFAELGMYTFPDANMPIVSALCLPDRIIVTPPAIPSVAHLLDCARTYFRPGDLVLLRQPQLDRRRYAALAQRVVPGLQSLGVNTLLTSASDEVEALGAAGLHLSSRRLRETRARQLPKHGWVSAACHDVRELEQAERIGADFVLVSPVRPTATHPGAVTLGWAGFAELVQRTRVPAYALGGVGAVDLATAWQHGGQGVAGISAFWPLE